ncbi:MAG: hypothetical protein K9N36_10715, partial [Candidatus Marinimicrobia bacterium]|nr:hypothetical protein [Candidatus Neomarinimicrobiota bacterium]
SSENPNHRFLSLTGVIIDLDYVGTTIFPEMERLKQIHFSSHPDEPIFLRRKELVQGKYPFQKLKNPPSRVSFDAAILALLEKWEYTVITVCLDKKEHKNTYQVWLYDPYHYCLALLLERFVMFLEQRDSVGDVMAESRGGREDRRLTARRYYCASESL